MKKTFYIIALGLLWFMWFTRANVDSMNIAPTTQSAISGSLVSFTVTGSNATGDAYLKYVLPQTAAYDIRYQSATLTPLNNALLSLGIEHDPVFYLPANSAFSVTITAKTITNVRTIPAIITTAIVGPDMQFSTVLTSAMAQLAPIADLAVTNVLTGENPSFSGDIVSYYITLQNIWSASATGITFISTFPIPTLSAPSASFDGTPRAYSHINYPQDFVWSGSYLAALNAGQTIVIRINAAMTQAFPVGTAFSQIAKATTASAEYNAANNTASSQGTVQSPADVRVTKTLVAPFTGYAAGDHVSYLITYGNSWGKPAANVIITDIPPITLHIPVFTLPTTTFTIGTLPAGSGGSFMITWTLTTSLTSWFVFVNKMNVTTTSPETTTGNNSSTATGIIQGISHIIVDIVANNITRPQLDTPPYGSGANVLIQAVSGDTVQLTITYANNGNTILNNATIGLSWVQGFSDLGTYNGTLGTLQPNMTGTIIVKWHVGPKNYISFIPTARLTYNGNQVITDSVTVQEPLVCGDGLLTRNEPCDTLGNLGVLFSGQVCENQQGMCVLVTQAIINNACINYQYANPLGGITTGQACSSVNAALTNASCNAMTGSSPVSNGNWYTVNLTCRGNNTTPTTPITIDCGNWTSLSWFWASFNGTCSYASSFVGNAQCRVGNDANNSACRLPISENGGQCESLDALDGTIAIVDDNGDAESTFRCETVNGATAQNITIDCGNWTQHTENNASVFETTCRYTDVDIPQTYNVKCSVDGISASACQQHIIVDEASLWYCGDGIREWYEDCDDGDDNWTSASNCTKGCDLKNSGLVGCFNVGNTNVSIQKWELLPFRWTLDAKKNIIAGNTCENKPDGKIPTDSIYCTFGIYNGDTSEEDDPIYTIREKCNEDNRGNMSLFSYFTNQQNGLRSLKNAFGKYYIPSDDFVTDTFGEYKVVLDKVEYKYCRSDDKTEGTEIDRVCSVNFTVTQPYLAQKSSFGLTPKATNISLEWYKTLAGDELIKDTDLEDIMVLDESEYDGGNKVQAMVNTFITKYEKLALTVPQSSLKNTVFEGLGITVKVVPQQKIYLLESDTKKTITLQNIKSFTAPFTIVTKNIDIIIKGNVDYNGMFLVKWGTITFEKSDEILGGDRCPSTQTVKGIFVTDEGFAGGAALANTDTSKQRCTYGWLYVKGILIGDNIQNIVESRRSQLNHRFTVGGTSDAAIKAERRNEIFNGAAVLIEYSPSLWNALPPGASEFTKALEIYKQ